MQAQIDLLKQIKDNPVVLVRIDTFIKHNTVDTRNFNCHEDFVDWQNDMFRRCYDLINDVKKLYQIDQKAIELYLSLDTKFFTMFSHKQQNAISKGISVAGSHRNFENFKGLEIIQNFSTNPALSKFLQDNIELLPSNTRIFVIAKSSSCAQVLNIKTIDNSFEAKAFAQQLDSKFNKNELYKYYEFFSKRKTEEALSSLFYFQNSLLTKYSSEVDNPVFKDFYSLIVKKIAFLFDKMFENSNLPELKCAKLIIEGCSINESFKTELFNSVKENKARGEMIALLSLAVSSVEEVQFLQECLTPHFQRTIVDKFFCYSRLTSEAQDILCKEYIEQFFFNYPQFLFKKEK